VVRRQGHRFDVTALGVSFADIPIASGQAAPIGFTFFWPAVDC